MFTGFTLNSKKYKNYGLYLKNKKNIPCIKKCNKVGLFTNARDEPHIKEWTAHHLLLGFDYIFITDHLSVVPLTHVFNNFDSRVIVKTCTIESSIKSQLMNEAIVTAKKYNLDWYIYLDADEFIILNNNVTNITNIKEFLYLYNGVADMIAINWLFFGSNYLEDEPDNILGSYTKSETHIDRHVKTFVRPNEVLYTRSPHVHTIKKFENFYSFNGKIGKKTLFNDYIVPFEKCPIYIAHYTNQSKETFIKRKVIKPRDDTGFYRTDNDKHLIENVHIMHNNVDNFQPKNIYHEKVQRFLRDKEINNVNDLNIPDIIPSL